MALGSAAGLRHLRGFRAGTDRFAAAGGGDSVSRAAVVASGQCRGIAPVLRSPATGHRPKRGGSRPPTRDRPWRRGQPRSNPRHRSPQSCRWTRITLMLGMACSRNSFSPPPTSTRAVRTVQTELDLRTVLALPILGGPLPITPASARIFSSGGTAHLAFVPALRRLRSLRDVPDQSGPGDRPGDHPGRLQHFEQGSTGDPPAGHARALWTWSPEWKRPSPRHLDRLETNILLIGGLIWTPERGRNTRSCSRKPKPGAADSLGRPTLYRKCRTGLHLSGEFGGSRLGDPPASGADDIVDYRDWRPWASSGRHRHRRLLR